MEGTRAKGVGRKPFMPQRTLEKPGKSVFDALLNSKRSEGGSL